MSDPKFGERDDQTREPAYGEPVDEPTTRTDDRGVDEVVGSANDSLAEAEAASRSADDRRRGDAAFDVSDRGSDLSIDYSKYSEPDAPVASSAVTSEPLYRATDDEAAAAPAVTTTTTDAAPSTAATTAYAHADATPTTLTPSEPAPSARPVSSGSSPQSSSVRCTWPRLSGWPL